MTEGQDYVADGPGGKSKGRVKGGQFIVQSGKREDGSLIQPTQVAAKTLKKLLARDGHSEDVAAAALRRFIDAPENTNVSLSPTLDAIKWQITGLQPALDGPLLDPVVPFKSAFEFLALHVGAAIYEASPALVAIRRALSQCELDPTHVEVERLHASEAKSFHGLLFEGNDPYAKVQVRLFGKLAFRVHFKLLSIAGPRGMYTHDLETNEEHVQQLSSYPQ